MSTFGRINYRCKLLSSQMKGELTEKEVKIKTLEYDNNYFKKMLKFIKFGCIPALLLMNVIDIIYFNRTIETGIIFVFMTIIFNYFFISKINIFISENERKLIYLKL